jgi:Na+/proline symporter
MPAGEWAFATLALGSALALFVYPHAVTGVFAAKRRDVIRRNAAMLPAYSLVLGLIALFGYLARAAPAVSAGIKADGNNPQLPVPLLFAHIFPSWFAGIGDSAIVVGALGFALELNKTFSINLQRLGGDLDPADLSLGRDRLVHALVPPR